MARHKFYTVLYCISFSFQGQVRRSNMHKFIQLLKLTKIHYYEKLHQS